MGEDEKKGKKLDNAAFLKLKDLAITHCILLLSVLWLIDLVHMQPDPIGYKEAVR